MFLTVVICTHNRRKLLEKAICSLNEAERPAKVRITILVVASACDDSTCEWLKDNQNPNQDMGRLPLNWVEEPKLGKSRALNRAISLVNSPLVAFVDDDHRVDKEYFSAIKVASEQYRETSLFCGRIVPDWDGREPNWAHDNGPYRIYPPPVPCFDLGSKPLAVTPELAIPGGGNLVIRREVFERVGGFSTEFGPRGRNLAGSEDSDFVLRTYSAGERLHYEPRLIQYHYVDPKRFSIRYLLAKSYHRSRSITRIKHKSRLGIPRYLWRKAAGYFLGAAISTCWPKTRFYLVRVASTLGEIQGFREGARDTPSYNARGTEPNGP